MVNIQLDDEKIEKIAEMCIQFDIDTIREHRQKIGLDPVWYPSPESVREKFDYYVDFLTEFLKSI
jgi:hypothetical protein